MSSIDRAFVEVGYALSPLGTALSSPDRLATFLRAFGIVVDGAESAQAHSGAGDLRGERH